MQFKRQLTLMMPALLILSGPAWCAEGMDAVLLLPDASLSAPAEVCAGSGELTFNVCMGTPPFTIYYSADDGTVDVDTVTGVSTGHTIPIHPARDVTYQITYIRDDVGAERTSGFSPAATASVTVNPLPDASLDISSTSVCAGESLNLIFNFCEGMGPFDVTYSITTSAGTVFASAGGLSHGSPLEVTPGEDAVYTITSVTDANGCTRSSGFNAIHATESVTVSPLPTGRLVAKNTDICLGETAALMFESEPGQAFKLVYSDGTAQHTLVNMENGDVIYVHPEASTTYSLLRVTGTNCSRTGGFHDEATVRVHAPAGFNVETACPGEATVFTVENGAAGSRYTWDFNGDGETDISTTDTVAAYLFAKDGHYTATLTATGTGSCPGTISKSITIAPAPEVFAGTDTSIVKGDSFTLPATANGHYSYQWSPDRGLSNAGVLNPRAFPAETTVYTLTATTAEGCTTSAEVVVTVNVATPATELLKIYNTFTPDNDQHNDLWVIDGIQGYPDNMVAVFDRWGNRLFLSRGYGQPWDGTSEGKELEAGTYYYVVNLNDGTPPVKGTVNIIR